MLNQQSHGKLALDSNNGKKHGAIIHGNEITDGFPKTGFQHTQPRGYHIPHFSTTLPPLVVSALPKIVRHTHSKPSLSKSLFQTLGLRVLLGVGTAVSRINQSFPSV